MLQHGWVETSGYSILHDQHGDPIIGRAAGLVVSSLL